MAERLESVRRWSRGAAALLPLAIFVVALVALHRLGGEFHLRDVLAQFRATAAWQVAAAALFTAASYATLCGYERAALCYVGARLPWRASALTAFVSHAIGNNVGAAALSGAAIRFRLYASAGLRASDIARLVAFCSSTFAIGMATLAGVSLLSAAGEAASRLHASREVAVVAGTGLLGAAALYLVASAAWRAPITLRGVSFSLPRPALAATQLGLSITDLLATCACAFVLLPDGSGVPFLAFAGAFMVALAASAVTAVPGGLGVFESTLVLLLPEVPAPQLLGALLAYRLVYYVAPFLLALVLLTAREAVSQRARAGAALAWTRRSLGLVVPQAMALLVFGAGCLLLASGATPGSGSRLAELQRFLPLPVLELSHLAGSAVGVLLLVLARGLLLRLDGAWHVTLWLLGAGAAASLLKGLDYEEALLLVCVALPLWWTRAQFHRKASLFAERLSPSWLASAGIGVGASIWIGLLAYRHVPYANELWWQFALDANAPRMLRASLLAVLVLGAFAALRLFAPARPPAGRPSPGELARAEEVIRSSDETQSNLALLGDKALLFSHSGRAFLMYAVSGRCWVAMGDPIGPEPEREELVWRFRELADQAGARSVFYQVGGERLATYVDAGLALSKLGEEARVPLGEFSLEGGARAELRQTHRRAQRDGLSFRIVRREDVAGIFPQLLQVSQEWLHAKRAAEKGFSLGRFEREYVTRFAVAVVERQGRIVAFANLWETGTREELSVDLMRHVEPAPRGAMDYLFVELMLWGRTQGYRWFNLGMAPLAGLEDHRLAPAWHKAGRFIHRHGEEFYNFAGLRKYKDKFQPVWRPRYLAAPGPLALPAVLLDVTRLISGRLAGAEARAVGHVDVAITSATDQRTTP